jgi:hypothetical protein
MVRLLIPKIPVMYKDYLDAIVWHYKQIKSKSELPQRLLQPSPGKIRAECVSVYKLRDGKNELKKDLGTLHTFFQVNTEDDLLDTIENFELDKFRQLAKFLRRGNFDPGDKHIELLGWLLDYPNRPYNDKCNYLIDKTTITDNDSNDTKQIITLGSSSNIAPNYLGPEKPIENPVIKGEIGDDKKSRRLIVPIVMALGVGAAVFFSNGSSRKECMVWNDDHYELVSCDSFSRGKDVWPVKKDRLNNFRRITRPDTISEKDIRNIWYIKRTIDSLDFFTDGGKDPVNPTRYLSPLSRYMYEKYILKRYH